MKRSIKRICVVGLVALLGACGEPSATTGVAMPAAALAVAPAAAPEQGGLPEANLAQWARSCALCHVRGEGGAPRLGDRQAWQPRLAQGQDLLLSHTIEGFNNMPPLGYCMDCNREDFRRLIRFMAVGS